MNPSFEKRRIEYVAQRERLRIQRVREARIALDALTAPVPTMSLPPYIKYNAMAQHWIPLVGDKARLYVERVNPEPCHLASMSVAAVPTYDDLVTLIVQKYSRVLPARFKWSIFTHGHTLRGQDTIDVAKGPT